MPYDPREHGALCDECPLQEKTPVPPKVLPIADALVSDAVAVVGECPSASNVKHGLYFTGPDGEEVVRGLRSAKIRQRFVHRTNAILCRPDQKLPDLLKTISKINRNREKKYQRNRKEDPSTPKPVFTKTPLECCAPRLEEELSYLEQFITMGRIATEMVSGIKASIFAVRGGLTSLDATERTLKKKVIPTLDPSFVLAVQRWRHVFRSDFEKAGKWFRGEVDWVPPNVTFQPTPSQLEAFLFDPSLIYTFDIETDGIESLTANIRCLSIGTSTDVMSVSVLSKDGQRRFYEPPMERAILAVLKRFFEDERISKAGHNAGYYDKIVLQQHWGISVKPAVLDTMLLHRNVESELPHGLAFVGSMYTEAPSWKCYDPETEVLTPDGWVKFPKLEKGVPVAQWDEGNVTFVKPSAYVDQAHKGKVWVLKDQSTDLVLTPDHGMVYKPVFNPKTCRVENKDKLRHCYVQDLPKTGYLPHVGTLEEGSPLVTDAFVRLIVAAQADGSWVSLKAGTCIEFGFAKTRKSERIRTIAESLGIDVQKMGTKAYDRIRLGPHPTIDDLWAHIGSEKTFGPWLLSWSLALRRVFLSELPLWDGTKGKDRTQYNTTEEINADWVQAVAVVSGQAARKYEYPNSSGNKPIHRVALPGGKKRQREWSKLEKLKREEIDYDGRVHCVSVPAGFLVVRRGGLVSIASNTDREGNKLSTQSETDKELAEYCANDVAVTARVIEPLVESILLRQQAPVFRVDQKMQAVCADMHTAGMFVDQNVRLAEEKRLLQRRHELLRDIRGFLGDEHFNPASVFQLRDLLFEKWKLEPPLDEEDLYTGTGDLSTSDLVLRSLLTDRSVEKDKREFLKLVRYYRKVQKVLGTYVVKLRPWNYTLDGDLGWDDDEDWVDRETRKLYGLVKRGIVDPRTGRMHPGYNAHVAVTGRLSSSKPINAQNFPKGLRAMVVAQPGHVLVGADMDQLELRIAAARWGVEIYLNAFKTGKDPHSMTAYTVFGEAFCKAAGITPDQFDRPGPLVGEAYINGKFEGSGDAKKMRDLSKAVQYASQYMATVETVHKLICKTEIPSKEGDGTTDLPYALMPLNKVRELRDNWLSGAKEFEYGWEKEIATYRRHGFLDEKVTGRRRDFLDGEVPNELVNFPIQASAAGLMNKAILELHEEIPLHKWGPGTGIINQCHDSIVVECPESEGERVAKMLEEAMNQEHESLPGVRFTASATIGTTWKQVG